MNKPDFLTQPVFHTSTPRDSRSMVEYGETFYNATERYQSDTSGSKWLLFAAVVIGVVTAFIYF